MRTTIDIPTPLFKQVKARAALQGRSLKDYMTELLQAEISNPLGAYSERSKKPVKLPLIRGKCGPMISVLTNAQIEALEDGDYVHH